MPIKVVQELLGHASVTTTMRYAHLAPADLRRAVDILCHPVQKVEESSPREDRDSVA